MLALDTYHIAGLDTAVLRGDPGLIEWTHTAAPLLGVYGDQDYTGAPQAFTEAVATGYRALQAGDQFQFEIKPGGHEFFCQSTIEFFGRHL